MGERERIGERDREEPAIGTGVEVEVGGGTSSLAPGRGVEVELGMEGRRGLSRPLLSRRRPSVDGRDEEGAVVWEGGVVVGRRRYRARLERRYVGE